MKKLNLKVGLMMALVMSVTAFISCSSDDEEGSTGGETTSKRIVKMTHDEVDNGAICIIIFDYDSQGRVVRENKTETDGSYESTGVSTYTYGGSTIIEKTRGGGATTYTLSNGRIIKEEWSYGDDNAYTYTYDSNGYIISIVNASDDSYISGYGNTEFTWIDGNLTKYTIKHNDGRSTICTISYSNIPWPQNWMLYWENTGMNEVFEPLGAWGKMPKNLPSKMFVVYDDGETDGYTIDYTIENGEIRKAIYKDLSGVETASNTYEWK